LDRFKKVTNIQRELTDLTPGVYTYTIKTDEEDIIKALKPYWKMIFKEEMLVAGHLPKITEANFYKWFDIKETTHCLK